MKRPKYCPRDGETGAKAEKAYHNYLHDKNIKHTWNNKEKESGDIDFVVHLMDLNVGVEVESKDSKFKSLFEKEGIDFIAAKVEKYLDYEPLAYYNLVLSDLVGFFSLPMTDIKVVGQLINKPNRRNWDGEEFYRVPLQACLYREF